MRELFTYDGVKYCLPSPAKISKAELAKLVRRLQLILWSDDTGVNPDSEWEVDTIERVAEVLMSYNLQPEEVECLS